MSESVLNSVVPDSDTCHTQKVFCVYSCALHSGKGSMHAINIMHGREKLDSKT